MEVKNFNACRGIGGLRDFRLGCGLWTARGKAGAACIPRRGRDKNKKGTLWTQGPALYRRFVDNRKAACDALGAH
jgi:hypothetical protein